MTDQSPKPKPTAQVSLELFPDSFQRLKNLRDHITRTDDQHWSTLSEAAHKEVRAAFEKNTRQA